ncbi:hypothetical protein ASPTUDRAFT_66756 [Aspergillus tubingensis CBS 134.48]|uniref:Uncharacterized protein n=1 Tax=Aspergillus tubingensis (strain CBS 134.48) TaxID=767770 RepID=A0A1L9MZX2_ASPTC|nr:hypothetical protein ASPTUDRAFT_66756 [Aspergillus tubingensis CBS 134.48]
MMMWIAFTACLLMVLVLARLIPLWDAVNPVTVTRIATAMTTTTGGGTPTEWAKRVEVYTSPSWQGVLRPETLDLYCEAFVYFGASALSALI